MNSILKFIGSTPLDTDPVLLSHSAQRLIVECLDDIDEIYDMHTHLGGSEQDVTGCCIHPNLNSIFHPFNFGQRIVFKNSSGITNDTGGDKEYLDKLISRTNNFSFCRNSNGNYPIYRHLLLALAKWYDKDGRERDDKTSMYIPNDYLMNVVNEHSDIFDPCISINPYNPDAMSELKFYAKQGVRIVKWLPNSMGITMTDPKIIPFYNKMAKYNMILLCHTGSEHAMSAGAVDQKLGNPLLLRAPLDCGVKVIAAHCASEGTNIDLDDPNMSKCSNFRLLLRLMDDPKYKNLLFADISSMLLVTRIGEPLTTMLDRDDLHENLVFGSDYPVPTIGLISRTDKLKSYGYINEEERILLNEIFYCNPLLYDFVAKRIIKSPNTGKKFPKSLFGRNYKLLN